MLTHRDRQRSFYDADSVCEQLIPEDSFYRKFREIVSPLIADSMFGSMYCLDNGRPPISPSLLAMACVLQSYRNLSDREMERACMYDIEIKYALGLRLDERPFDHSSLGTSVGSGPAVRPFSKSTFVFALGICRKSTVNSESGKTKLATTVAGHPRGVRAFRPTFFSFLQGGATGSRG